MKPTWYNVGNTVGSLTQLQKSLIIGTLFSFSDQEKLRRMLKSLGLETTINKDKSYYRLRFLKESIKKLNQLISEYTIPSMRYKLSYDPVETWSRMDRSSPEYGELTRQLPLEMG